MIHTFVKTCCRQGDKIAFISGNQQISFRQLLQDVHRMGNLIRHRIPEPGNGVLLLVPPSYPFYVLLFACIYCGVPVVVMDSYKDLSKVRQTMQTHGITHVFCNGFTQLLRPLFPVDTHFVRVTDYENYPDSALLPNEDPEKIVLTTFTSGTTGNPKPIRRSIRSLQAQVEAVRCAIDMDEEDVVYASLPIYALLVVYAGLSCVIGKQLPPDQLTRCKVNTVIAPLAELLAVEKPLPCVKKLCFGGAILYTKEARRLQNTFPNAQSHYIYGASECALIAHTSIEHYLSHKNALANLAQGVELSVMQPDANGIGRLCVSGPTVLTEDGAFLSGDLGYLDDRGIHIVGRANYSLPGQYNYLLDDQLLSENPKVQRGFSFAFHGKVYFCYRGKLTKTRADICYLPFRKLPMDAKHKTKLDYRKVIQKIQAKGF